MDDKKMNYADDLVSKAMMFAIAAHSGQFRKGGKTPAIVHAMEAAVISSTLTDDIEVMAAALLHDTVEDTGVEPEEIEMMFGEKVAALVAGETENKRNEMKASDSWLVRKQESLDELKENKDINAKILWLSDKLSNMRSFYRLYREKGADMWEGFNQKDTALQEWYYRTISDSLQELNGTAAYQEYTHLVNIIFGKDENNEHNQ